MKNKNHFVLFLTINALMLIVKLSVFFVRLSTLLIIDYIFICCLFPEIDNWLTSYYSSFQIKVFLPTMGFTALFIGKAASSFLGGLLHE